MRSTAAAIVAYRHGCAKKIRATRAGWAVWFGYKHHVLVDVKHEVPLAWHSTDPKVGGNERVPAPVEQARANLPAGRMATLAYDKAADAEKVHEFLHQAGIKPLIHNRALWQDDPERLLPGKAGRYPLHAMHDEAGTVYSATTG